MEYRAEEMCLVCLLVTLMPTGQVILKVEDLLPVMLLALLVDWCRGGAESKIVWLCQPLKLNV